MKKHCTTLAAALVLHLTFSILHSAFASVPLAWQVTPRNPAPVAFDRHHGETLEFRCAFSGFGELPFGQAADIRLWYQTNGMSSAWWSVPASVSSNVLSATFTPQSDPGADRLALFFGAPSNAYASAVLRLRHSPGFTPNVLPAPESGYTETDPVFAAWLTTNDLVHTEMDPTVPAWAKSEIPPHTMTTNDVQGIVTNETVGGWSRWTLSGLPEGVTMVSGPELLYGTWSFGISLDAYPEDVFDGLADGGEDAERLEFDIYSTVDPADRPIYHIIATRTYTPQYNSLGLARLVDLPPLTNGLASAASVSAANSRAASAQSAANAASNTAASVAATVTAWETFWDGDNVRVTVTNYDSAVNLPALYIEYKMENTDDYRTVWDERTRWQTNEVEMAELRSAIDEKADRAWGYYDSHTGDYAPDGYTWLSSPRIAIAGGLAYQRTLTTAGAVWVLSSNGMVAQTGGTDEDGFFRIKDDEGNTTFEIVRGNKRTVGATAAGIKVTSSGGTTSITIPYNVVSTEAPTLYGTADLASGEWTQLTPTWTGQSGAWTGTVTTASSQYFVKGEYETGGETYIKNVAPVSVESGIYCTDGIHKVRPVYTNGTITWEVVQ